MLHITIPAIEQWDEINEQFINTKEQKLSLEHSLVSLSKWESKWCKPFFSKQEKTQEQIIDYVRCMTITQNVNPEIYKYLSRDDLKQINDYIDAVNEIENNGHKARNKEDILEYNKKYIHIPDDTNAKYIELVSKLVI